MEGLHRSNTTANSAASPGRFRAGSRAIESSSWRDSSGPVSPTGDVPLYGESDLARTSSMPVTRTVQRPKTWGHSTGAAYNSARALGSPSGEVEEPFRSLRANWREPGETGGQHSRSATSPGGSSPDYSEPHSPLSHASEADAAIFGLHSTLNGLAASASVRRHQSLNLHQRSQTPRSNPRLAPIGSPPSSASSLQTTFAGHSRAGSENAARIGRSRAGTGDGSLSITTSLIGNGPWSPTAADVAQLASGSHGGRHGRSESMSSLQQGAAEDDEEMQKTFARLELSPEDPSSSMDAITPTLRAAAIQLPNKLSPAGLPVRRPTPTLPPLNTRVSPGGVAPQSAAAYVPPIGHAHSTAPRTDFSPTQNRGGASVTAGPGVQSDIWNRQKDRIAGQYRGSPMSTPPIEDAPYRFGTGPFSPSSGHIAPPGHYGPQQQQLWNQQPNPLADGLPPNWLELLQAGMQVTGYGQQPGFMPPPQQPVFAQPHFQPNGLPGLMPQFGQNFVAPQLAATWSQPAHPPPQPVPAPSIIAPEVAAFAESRGLNPSVDEFDIAPQNARFFVIKSLTEDDVHKSIKHEIWASTPLGNKRLDKSWRDAQKGPDPTRIFNASGHFCGVAEMLSGVDESVDSTVWNAQGKWKGMIKVGWIFVRDIPNNALRHLKLSCVGRQTRPDADSNTPENKPVTSSRDTQEVPHEIGCEMLRIFTSFPSKTSLLHDFAYYDSLQPTKGQDPVIVASQKSEKQRRG